MWQLTLVIVNLVVNLDAVGYHWGIQLFQLSSDVFQCPKPGICETPRQRTLASPAGPSHY